MMSSQAPENPEDQPLWFGGWGVHAATLASAKRAHLQQQWPLLSKVEDVIVDVFTHEIMAPASDRLFNYRFAHLWVQEHDDLRSRLLDRLSKPVDSPDQARAVTFRIDILLAGLIGSGLRQEHLNSYFGRVAELELQGLTFRQTWRAALGQDPALVHLAGLVDGQANYARYELDNRVAYGFPDLPNRLLNPEWFAAGATDLSDAGAQVPLEVLVGTTAERIEMARKATNKVAILGAAFMVILALVIALLGIWLGGQGKASAAGSVGVAGFFAAFGWLIWWTTKREFKKAQQFVAGDGFTQFRITAQSLTVADTVIPFEQITGIFFNLEKEIYSTGGIRGEIMAQRLGLEDRESLLGRSAGSFAGSRMRRKLYTKGAKSWAQMTVGVVGRDALLPAPFKINPMHSLPKSGLNSGRIDIPVGAYLTRDHLVVLFEALTQPAQSYGFPLGVVSGTMSWAQAQTMLSGTPEQIRQEAAQMLPAKR